MSMTGPQMDCESCGADLDKTATLFELKEKLEDLKIENNALKEGSFRIETGINQYGVDIGYFRNTINRELNRSLSNFKPEELARVFARMALAADKEVLMEPEFQVGV